ncbi:MAG TPA: cytochrome c biogenesis protein ResB, partial [Propionibacteriaceae bacterium]|nr:cytochrome c biogenesis protein ResB [Propionibacteriaceae bacterium]
MSVPRSSELDDTRDDLLHSDAGEPTDLSLGEFARRLFRFFHNKDTGLTLILAMAVLTLLGTLVMQVPDQVLDDPAAYAHWIEDVRPKYRGWTDVLKTLQLFNVFSSIWFAIVAIALSLSIVACTVHRLPQLWRNARAPHTHVTEHFFDHARQHATVRVPLAPELAMERVQEQFRGRRYRTIADQSGSGPNLYADAHRYAPFGTAIAHAAFVIILIGVLISSTFGFTDTGFTVTVGERAEVGHDTGLAIELRSFSDTYYPSGQPQDYVSDVVLFENGTQVASQVVRVNEPLRWNGVGFYQTFFGVAAVMTVTDGQGATIHTGGVPLQWQTDDGVQYGELALPGDLTAYVIAAGAGKVTLELYDARSDTAVGSTTVVQG